MPGSRPPLETVSKALRRRAQLQRWQRQSRRAAEHATGTSVSATTGSAATAPRSAPATSGDARVVTQQTSAASVGGGAAAAAPAPRDAADLHAGHTLQHAYAVRESPSSSPPLQRRLVSFLRHSTSAAEAAEAFFLAARTQDSSLTPATVAAFTSALLRHNIAAQMGAQAYEAALADAVGAAADSRWGHTSPAEARAFAVYQARRLERYSVKGTLFQEQLGLTLEGGDNGVVALTEYQLRKSSASAAALPVSCDSLVELIHLDISWSTALHVYQYAAELVPGVEPPADMTARLMGLMTGYRTNGLGSRPWRKALELYGKLLRSGYEVPLDAHAAALDAVWRSGESFVKPHHTLCAADRDGMWQTLVHIRERVPDDHVTGDAGCRFTEALIKAAAAAGRWEAAVQLLEDTDLTLASTTHRLLVPTPEALLFTMAACNAAGNAARASALREAFSALYTLRSAHPEALLSYLHSLRHVVQLSSDIGEQVEALVADGAGLDRPCCVACLQLLASRRVQTTRTEKWRVAQRLLDAYDSNPWPQEPQVRKTELQTVFRCCHLIAAAAAPGGPPCPLLPDLRARLVAVFGRVSPECRWLEDTEVYGILTATRWEAALEVYERQVRQRPPARVPDLPIPLRQVRHMLAATLLRCVRASGDDDGGNSGFLLDEDGQAGQRAATLDFTALAVRTVREVYADTDDTAPHGVVAELLLQQALLTPQPRARQQLALEAMREMGCGVASNVTPRVIDLVSQALSLTVEHVETVLVDGSAALRADALAWSGRRGRLRASSSLEAVFV